MRVCEAATCEGRLLSPSSLLGGSGRSAVTLSTRDDELHADLDGGGGYPGVSAQEVCQINAVATADTIERLACLYAVLLRAL